MQVTCRSHAGHMQTICRSHVCILTAEVECNQCFLVACDVAGESLVTEVELGRDFRTFESGEDLAKVVVLFHWRGEVNNWGPYKGKGGVNGH